MAHCARTAAVAFLIAEAIERRQVTSPKNEVRNDSRVCQAWNASKRHEATSVKT